MMPRRDFSALQLSFLVALQVRLLAFFLDMEKKNGDCHFAGNLCQH